MTYGEFLTNGDTVAVAAERCGTSFSDVLPGVNADALREILAPVMDKNALLVTDSNTSDSPCAAALGVSHEVLNQSSGECVRSELHIKNVSNRHSRLKGFIGGRWGIFTRYLVGYLRWYHLIVVQKYPTSRFCFASAMGAMSVYTVRELSDCLLDSPDPP